MEQHEITTHPGAVVTATGYVVGGGAGTATPELKALVQKAAASLAGRFQMPVEIRFNSNGLSGGAWLDTPARNGRAAKCDVGVTVSFFNVHRAKANFDRYFSAKLAAKQMSEWLEVNGWHESLGHNFTVVKVYIAEPALRDPNMAQAGTGAPGHRYHSSRQACVDEAVTYLAQHAKRPPVPEVMRGQK